jgi:hypothetical protein
VFRQIAANHQPVYLDNRAVFSKKRMKVSRRMIIPVHDDPYAIDYCDRGHFLFARSRVTKSRAIDIARKNCTIVDDSRRKLFDRQVFCVRQIGAAQDCSSQERALKVRVPKGSIRGIRAGQVRAAERYAAEISPADESPMNIERPLRRPDLVFQHHDSPSLSLRSFMISCTSMGGASSP